jgi:hypothetical protein
MVLLAIYRATLLEATCWSLQNLFCDAQHKLTGGACLANFVDCRSTSQFSTWKAALSLVGSLADVRHISLPVSGSLGVASRELGQY